MTTVALVRYEEAYRSLRQVLALSNGLAGLNKHDRILLKPNLVSWDFVLPFPPFGVVTTAAVVAALVRILKEEGFDDLTIGEGSLHNSRSLGREIFGVLGYEKLVRKYGVKLMDFNEDQFEEVDLGPHKLSVASTVLAADKIINLPVLKTHNQCRVSLGIKNLKGTINRRSKTHCHGRDWELEHTFPLLAEKLPVALTVIDGLFTLEKGPGPTGKAYRKNLLIASTDILAADIVGAEVMGYRAENIEHLVFFARRQQRSLRLENIEIKGESLAAVREFVDYDWEWQAGDLGPVGFAKRGISGLAVRKYDSSLCTGCSGMYNPMLIMLMSAFKGQPFPNLEVVSGKRQLAAPGFDYTLLFGKCVWELNRDNPNIKQAIVLKGCPPSLSEMEEKLRSIGLDCNYQEYVNYRHYLFNRYRQKEGFDLGLYRV